MCSNLNLFKHFTNDLTLINNAFCSNSFNIKIGRATLCDSPIFAFLHFLIFKFFLTLPCS